MWSGVALADVLRATGLKSTAVYTANYGTDVHLSGDPSKETLSRGVPIAKAMNRSSMLVWAMNGKPLENIHGGPLRLVIPGWPGSVSHKWLSKITIRDKVHDGQGMGGTSYRVAIKPMVPGGRTDDSNFKILESMPVRGILTSPGNGTRYPTGTREVRMRGAAWAGDLDVRGVDVSVDFRRHVAAGYAGGGAQQVRLAALDHHHAAAERRLLRGLGAGNRPGGQGATPHRRRLEPARLRRQPDAPDRRAGG